MNPKTPSTKQATSSKTPSAKNVSVKATIIARYHGNINTDNYLKIKQAC